jgi:hypothetical protein
VFASMMFLSIADRIGDSGGRARTVLASARLPGLARNAGMQGGDAGRGQAGVPCFPARVPRRARHNVPRARCSSWFPALGGPRGPDGLRDVMTETHVCPADAADSF